MGTNTGRASWQDTWLLVADAVAGRARCVNSSVGAVVVTADNRVAATGYNGPPRGFMAGGPCSGWCPRAAGNGTGTADYSACESIHAEVNALLRADATLIQGGTMYVTRVPCVNCARVVANSGVRRIVARRTPEDDPVRVNAVDAYLAGCGVALLTIGTAP